MNNQINTHTERVVDKDGAAAGVDKDRAVDSAGKVKVASRASKVAIAVSSFLFTTIVVFAISKYFTSRSTTLPNWTGELPFEISLGSLSDQGAAVVPGSVQEISTTIQNQSNIPMYLYVVLECGTYTDESGSTGSTPRPIYTFTPGVDSGWILLEGVENEEKPGNIVCAYVGDGSSYIGGSAVLRLVDQMEEVEFYGLLTCTVPKEAFLGLDDRDVEVVATAYAIGTDGGSGDPLAEYMLNVEGR